MPTSLQDIQLEDIYEFRDHGNWDEAPSEVVQTLDMMDKIRGLYLRGRQFGSRDGILNHLEKVEGLSHYLACKYYDMTMEYFYCDRQISKQAHRYRIAEKMEKLLDLGMVIAKDVSDLTKISKGLMDVAKVLGLDQPDADPFPEELLARPFKMYSIDAAFVGLPEIDRNTLKKQILAYEGLSEKEQNLAMREALILPPKLFLDAHENPRNTQS